MPEYTATLVTWGIIGGLANGKAKGNIVGLPYAHLATEHTVYMIVVVEQHDRFLIFASVKTRPFIGIVHAQLLKHARLGLCACATFETRPFCDLVERAHMKCYNIQRYADVYGVGSGVRE